MICVHDFPRGEVSMKVGVMELGFSGAGLGVVVETWVRFLKLFTLTGFNHNLVAQRDRT